MPRARRSTRWRSSSTSASRAVRLIERVARNGSPSSVPFAIAQMTDQAPDFSFSGLKTAVSLHVKRNRPLGDREVADIAASFQAAAVKMLVRKTARAAVRLGVARVVLTGGVAANTALREGLAAAAAEHGFHLHVPPRHLCTDNAAMIAAAGSARLAAGQRDGLDLNAVPDLRLDAVVERSEATARAGVSPGARAESSGVSSGARHPSGRAEPGSPRVQ